MRFERKISTGKGKARAKEMRRVEYIARSTQEYTIRGVGVLLHCVRGKMKQTGTASVSSPPMFTLLNSFMFVSDSTEELGGA